MDYSLPAPSVHGISQVRTLEWVAISFSRGSSWLRGWAWVPYIDEWILIHCTTREVQGNIFLVHKKIWTGLPWWFSAIPGSSDGKASVYNAGDPGSIPESGRSPGEGNSNPLQYSGLRNPMEREVWQTTANGLAKKSDMTWWLNNNHNYAVLFINK